MFDVNQVLKYSNIELNEIWYSLAGMEEVNTSVITLYSSCAPTISPLFKYIHTDRRYSSMRNGRKEPYV